NLAELWDLPVIYVIENNGYSMGTSQKRSSAFKGSLAQRGEAYGIAWESAKGHDIYEVRAKTHEALKRAHQENRPTILELATYRYQGHSVADANAKKYRTPEEIVHHKENFDPINVWKNQLIKEGVLSEESYRQIDTDAKAEARESVEFAEKSPYPEVSAITEDVYFEVDQGSEAGKQGRHFFHD
ncbi:MAG: pyruvate dehydrogenase (acetyl-transferring) E1 component subunit alpha, partial [Verrucomicrobiaceae bacterium]|nr:pyruvate dehydrogenase (acetyl-transferring) E1 component subunit alpha [Verrucomicrobiaceae bacterium]